jgi:hypothetical protein
VATGRVAEEGRGFWVIRGARARSVSLYIDV